MKQPIVALAIAALLQSYPRGVSTAVTSGTTPISGGATTQVCFNDAGVLACGDAGLVYNKTTDLLSPSGGVSLNSTATNHKIVSRTVTLTEAGGAEVVITITTVAGDSFGLELTYKVHVSDSTPDYAIREGSLKMVCVNKAGTVSCTKDATAQTDDESVLISPATAKTLTYAIAVDVATANVAKITFNIDSDIVTVAVGNITYTATLNGQGTIS